MKQGGDAKEAAPLVNHESLSSAPKYKTRHVWEYRSESLGRQRQVETGETDQLAFPIQ